MEPCPDSEDMEPSSDSGDTGEDSSDSGEMAEDSSDSDDYLANSGPVLDFTRAYLPAHLERKAEKGPDPEGFYCPCIRRGEDEEPFLTPEQEERLIRKQVKGSKGFDIDFKMFRSVFNYRPVDFEVDDRGIIDEPLTTKELMENLSRQSLANFNVKKQTRYEFVKVLYANYNADFATGTLYFITFQGKDPWDDNPKQFQAKVCNYYFQPDKYVSCKLKPEIKRGHSNETQQEKDEDAKRTRLMQEGETSSSLAL